MKIATIGTSQICATMIENMKNCGYEVIACFSRDIQKAIQFAKDNDIKFYFDNMEEFLKSSQFDFVYIATPNAIHYEQIKLALENQKNVIVEKPIVLNTKQMDELIEIARNKKLYLFEAMCNYYLPNVKQLKKELDTIKPLKIVNLNFHKYSTRYDKLKNGEVSNVFDYKMGGGALMDIGCYNISLAIELFGLPKKVYHAANFLNRVDTSGVSLLEYDDFKVSAAFSKDTSANNQQYFYGEKGFVVVEGSSSRMLNIKIYKNNGAEVSFNLNNDKHYEHQLLEFKKIFVSKKHKECMKLLNRSYDCINTLECLRKTANIVLEEQKN